MTVDLSPETELPISDEVREFTPDVYCANCTHVVLGGAAADRDDAGPYCEYWEEATRVESGMACPEYRPQGFGPG